MTSTIANSARPRVDAPTSATGTRLKLRCPVCAADVSRRGDSGQLLCTACGFFIEETEGIARALVPERYSYFSRFIREYEMVRTAEGRGTTSADYYLELPFKDMTGRNSWQWKIRARSYRAFGKRILPAIENRHPLGFEMLDLGAGNCWLSFRMALRGHRPVAVDLLDNAFDGLAAARHYQATLGYPMPLFQAEMDRLPFASAQFDLAIFNASFHYSTDYHATLREALRCLRRPGYVVIADSPFYEREVSGKDMIREKHESFERQYGFRSDAIPSLEYITPEVLTQLAREFNLTWKFTKPWYGINWALRPLKARLQSRRTPSQFFLIWAEVGQ